MEDKIFNKDLEDIKDESLRQRALKEIEKKKVLVESDYYRPKFHIAPHTGLLNDPNGFIYSKGEYNLFYQWDPFSTKHGLKYWYYVKSKDLVNWQEQGIGMAPSRWYETHGCYSGSAIEHEGEIKVFYTGNVKDSEGNRETYQCSGTVKKDGTITKSPFNPLIKNQPEGYTRHFRDPKVFKKDKLWYMVIGTQTNELKGRVLLYRSEDLIKWNLIGEVTGSCINGLGEMGYMFECPDLFNLSGKDVLIACPQGMKPEGRLYNNRYQSGYFVGKVDYSTGAMNHGEFVELDRGFEFYAPQTTEDEKGRRILIGWMGMPEEEDMPTVEYGWIHMLTLPRVLELKEKKIYQNPPEELKALRKEILFNKGLKLKEEKYILPISEDVFELELLAMTRGCGEFVLKLRENNEGTQFTAIIFDAKNGILTLDRDNSGEALNGKRSVKLNNEEEIKLRIYSDTSSMEIFVNDGEEVFTSRIFPSKESKRISIEAKEGQLEINELIIWKI